MTVTEVRVVFHTTPWLGFVPRDAPRPEANQLVLRIGPNPGARMRMQAKEADGSGLRTSSSGPLVPGTKGRSLEEIQERWVMKGDRMLEEEQVA